LTAALIDIVFCYQIGTDIEDFKCSWLVVKGMEICNEEQKKLLHVGEEYCSIHFAIFC